MYAHDTFCPPQMGPPASPPLPELLVPTPPQDTSWAMPSSTGTCTYIHCWAGRQSVTLLPATVCHVCLQQGVNNSASTVQRCVLPCTVVAVLLTAGYLAEQGALCVLCLVSGCLAAVAPGQCWVSLPNGLYGMM